MDNNSNLLDLKNDLSEITWLPLSQALERVRHDHELTSSFESISSYSVLCLEGQRQSVSLKSPIELKIERGETGFLIINEFFNIVGYGETKEAAIEDFSDFFINDYLNYKDTPADHLDSGAKRLLEAYNHIINRIF